MKIIKRVIQEIAMENMIDANHTYEETVIVEGIKTLNHAKRMQGGLVNTESNENCQYLLQYENENEIIAQYITEIIATEGNQERLILILTNMKRDLLDMFNQQQTHATTT